VKILGVLLNVSFERNEIFVNETRNFLVFVGLGLQPGTSFSARSGTEIDQHRFV
jgi:hypothetical protein